MSHIVIVGVLGYIALVLLLRISGNRTLSKMNSFDLIITITFGSTFATAMLNKKTTLIDAVTAFALLIFLQFLVTFISVRSDFFERIVKSHSIVLFKKGEFLREEMKKARVTEEEIKSGIRQEGIAEISQVEEVILEENGKISVTKKPT